LLVDSDGLAGGSLPAAEAGNDTGSVPDAAADGPSDSSTPGPCPADAFCDDFDDGGISAGWTQVTSVAGNVTVAEGKGRSAPAALRSVLFDGDASTDKGAMLVKDLGGRTSLHCSFALWIERANTDTDIISFTWKMENGKELFTWLDSWDTKTVLGRYIGPSGPGLSVPEFPLLPRRRWIDVDFKTDFISIELRFDGALVHREPLGNGTTPRTTQVTMKLGGFSGETEGNEFLYDDVRCE
jgi:hypothetical protein